MRFKILTVEPAIKDIIRQKNPGDFDPASGTKGYKLYWKTNSLLSVNILEAMAQDFSKSYEANGEAGYELALLDGLFDGTRQANRVRWHANTMGGQYRYSPAPRNWVDLYQSWNLNFLFNQFHSAPIMAMKLLIPEVGS